MQSTINWGALSGISVLLLACSPQPPTPMKTLPAISSEAWAQQDVATNVQDWDRAATKIADELEHNSMLVGKLRDSGSAKSRAASGNTFFIRVENDSMFLRQLKAALETEICDRGGATSESPIGAYTIDLRVDVVRWGSRLSSAPDVKRREAVWQATLLSGSKTALSVRQPFYIRDSDVALYENVPYVPSPNETLAQNARQLRYSSQ